MNVIILRPTVFFVGFSIGLMTVLFYDYAARILGSQEFDRDVAKTIWSLLGDWSLNAKDYDAWFRKQENARVSKLDLDAYYYGTTRLSDDSANEMTLESEWLKTKVPITCVVLVEKLKLAVTIKDTWGRHCNNLFFFSRQLSDLDLPVINLEISYTSSWQLLCEVMNYIWKRRDQMPLNWLIFVKDDTFVVPENLRYMLAPLDHNEPHYLGHPVVLWGLPYNVAQAGYVISYEVLRRLMELFDTHAKCSSGGKYWKKEDFYLGKHLAAMGIQPSDTRDSKQRGTFHGFPLNVILWNIARPDSYYTKALYPSGSDSCSDRSITFNIGEPDKMRTINYLLYHLRVFGNGSHGNKMAPTPVPEDEVWRAALRDEFNMTDVDEISSDMYFQMWRKKYSEPELFLAKSFKGVAKP